MVEANVGLDGFVINGMTISKAIPPDQLHEALGFPDRIVDPTNPAPFGHRNNQIHVYDRFGFYFNEHHWTRLAESITFLFWPEEQDYPFSPGDAFAGNLTLAMYSVPSKATEAEVIRDCPISWKPFLRGMWHARHGDIRVGIEAKGEKLKSGRRSARRRLVSVNVSWPHDPWQRLDRYD